MEAVGQLQADEIERMGRLIRAVKQQHRLLGRVAPLEEVEALMAHDHVAREIADVVAMFDAQIVGALEQRRELFARRHVKRFGRLCEVVQVHANEASRPAEPGSLWPILRHAVRRR